MPLTETLAPVVDLIFPSRCPLCSEGIPAQTGRCSAVWNELAIPAAPACTLCQRPLGDGMVAVAVCAPCLAEGPRHDRIAAGTLCNDASRRLVQAFKHGQRIALAPMMARLMAAALTFRRSGLVSGDCAAPSLAALARRVQPGSAAGA